jgi:hypothetical protein
MNALIKIGDRIKFCSPVRGKTETVWRVVNGFWLDTGQPLVRYNGSPMFIVRLHEISEVETTQAA